MEVLLPLLLACFARQTSAGAASAQSLSQIAVHQQPHLPVFTYSRASPAANIAAHLYGTRIRQSRPPPSTPAFRPPPPRPIIRYDSRRRRYYRYSPKQHSPTLLAQMRQQHRLDQQAVQRRYKADLESLCYHACNTYVNDSFVFPTMPDANPYLTGLLQSAQVRVEPAKYLTLSINRMVRVAHSICTQWEAHYQCAFGCSGSAAFVHRIKRMLKGDHYLTANVECPNPGFVAHISCIGTNLESWLTPCSSQLAAYHALNRTATGRVRYLEHHATLQAQAMRGPDTLVFKHVTPYAMSIHSELNGLCSAYGDFLQCAMSALQRRCSPQAASFMHTSMSNHFVYEFTCLLFTHSYNSSTAKPFQRA